MDRRPKSRKPTQNKKVIVVGTSNTRAIDMDRFSTANWFATWVEGMTISQATAQINTIDFEPDCVVVHSGTNDLETKDTDLLITQHTEMIKHYRERFPDSQIVISALLPRKGHSRNVYKINAALQKEYSRQDNTVFYSNSHFRIPENLPDFFIADDPKHLNKAGLNVFISGLKKSVSNSLYYDY